MNREIKFRAWDNHSSMKEVFGIDEYSLYFKDYEPENGVYGIVQTITRDTRSVYKLMQYAGLKDKNGVEIYEGDIVEFTWQEKYIGRGLVEYELDGFHIRVSYKDAYELSLPNKKNREVIGNIYENPELLEDN